MAEDSEVSHEREDADALAGRTTAPQSPFTMREVGIGALVALVGMLVVFAVPLLLA